MKTGILFDLDGTLLDTLEDLRDAVNYALNLHGYPLRSIGEVRHFVGNGAENLIRRALSPGGEAAEVRKVLASFQTYYTGHCQIKTKPYPGIPEALALLRENIPWPLCPTSRTVPLRRCAPVIFLAFMPWAKFPAVPESQQRIWCSPP